MTHSTPAFTRALSSRREDDEADGTLFLGSVGGPYVSTDNGDSWVRVVNGLDTTLVRRVVVTPSGSIFAATRANGVYVSTDGGQTWAMTGPTSSDVFHSEQGRIQTVIREEGIEDRVHWSGFVPDEQLRLIHAAALALVLPSA